MAFKPHHDEDDAGESSPLGPGRGSREFFSGQMFSLAFLASIVGFLVLFTSGTIADMALGGERRSFADLVLRASGTSSDSLISIAQVVAAVLGVALTVVAIVVQLAANRYTPRIVDLFIRDPVNLPTLALFVMTVLDGLWVARIRDAGLVPQVGMDIVLALSTISILILLPYFRHVFRFLEPARVVHRMRDEMMREIERARLLGTDRACTSSQARIIRSLDHLFDIARNSVTSADRSLATEVVFAFRDSMGCALDQKSRLPKAWFRIAEATTSNADFLNFPEPALAQFERERNWFGRKVFWQLNLLFQAAVGRMRGLCSTIALVTEEIGAASLERGERAEARLCVRAFNTYVRSGLNGHDVRSLYNLLQHYRHLAEKAVAAGDHALVREICTYFRYYGRTAESMGLGFVLETATHDLVVLLKRELSLETPAAEIAALFEVILDLGRDTEALALRPATRHGVRRSQCVLAAHLLALDREDLVRRVADEIRVDGPARLVAVRDEILGAEAEFFELTERVASFGYVDEVERPHIAGFFARMGLPSALPARGAAAHHETPSKAVPEKTA